MRIYQKLLIQWILFAIGVVTASSRAYDDHQRNSHPTKQRSHPNPVDTRTTGRTQTIDHKLSRRGDTVDSSTVRTHHKNIRQNGSKTSDLARYDGHHDTEQRERSNHIRGKDGGETTKQADDRINHVYESRNAPTDKGFAQKESNADYRTTATDGSENQSNERQYQPDPRTSQYRVQHSHSSDSSRTKTEKLQQMVKEENDLTDFNPSPNSNPEQANRQYDHPLVSTAKAATKRDSSSHYHTNGKSVRLSSEHDPTGDTNIDWNSKLDGDSRSNPPNAPSDDSSNKMAVVYCTVIFFLLVSAYQLKPH